MSHEQQSNNKERPTLVVLSPWYEPYIHGGAEQMVREMLERLGPTYSTFLITGRYSRTLPRTETRNGFTIVRVGLGVAADKFLYPILAALHVRRFRPDVIHANMESYAGIALIFARYTAPYAKRILTLQSGDLDDPRKQRNVFIRLFWKSMHRTPHVLTAISSFLAARGDRLRAGMSKTLLTPNGVDLSHVPTASVRVPQRVVCVARLNWAKGLDYLLEAWPAVLTNFPKATLRFVGDGEKRQEMEKRIAELGIGDSISFAGKVTHDVVLKEMSEAEVFVCPSLAEGLGIVFIEAQACGLPTIGTRVGGIPDIIEHEKTGLLIEPKNSEQISAAIMRVLGDRAFAAQLVENAKESVHTFEWDKVMQTIDEVYRRVLQENGCQDERI